MTSSSEPAATSALDTMLLVYGLLEDHPARDACRQFLRGRVGWLTSALTLLETRVVLTKVYGVSPGLVLPMLTELVTVPVTIVPFDSSAAWRAMDLTDGLRVDLTDGALLAAAEQHAVRSLATDDRKLGRAAEQLGYRIESPITPALRRSVTKWERAHLVDKGLPRVLRYVHRWLDNRSGSLAEEFWCATGAGSHLP